MRMDGYDDCIVGYVERFGMGPILCYDKEKVLAKLAKDFGNREDALEWYHYNQLGSYVGEGTPCFLITDKDDVIHQ